MVRDEVCYRNAIAYCVTAENRTRVKVTDNILIPEYIPCRVCNRILLIAQLIGQNY